MNKKIILFVLLVLMLLAGCSSSAASEKEAGDVRETTVIDPEEKADAFSRSIDSAPLSEENDADVVYESIARDYSQYSELSFEDFDFYGDVMYNGVPEDAYFPTLSYGTGEWKYDLIFVYDSSVDGYYFEEIGYADLELDYDKETVIITLHPRLANDGFEVWEESDEEIGYEPFEGGFDENDELLMYGNYAVLNPHFYYAWEGREYFIGTLWVSEEDSGVFLMTRGQD
jgi:hypothetical protein